MLPETLRDTIEKMEEMTASHRRCVVAGRGRLGYMLMASGILNVCCPYASRDEISSAVRNSVGSASSTATIE